MSARWNFRLPGEWVSILYPYPLCSLRDHGTDAQLSAAVQRKGPTKYFPTTGERAMPARGRVVRGRVSLAWLLNSYLAVVRLRSEEEKMGSQGLA